MELSAPYSLSRRVPSATRPPLRDGRAHDRARRVYAGQCKGFPAEYFEQPGTQALSRYRRAMTTSRRRLPRGPPSRLSPAALWPPSRRTAAARSRPPSPGEARGAARRARRVVDLRDRRAARRPCWRRRRRRAAARSASPPSASSSGASALFACEPASLLVLEVRPSTCWRSLRNRRGRHATSPTRSRAPPRPRWPDSARPRRRRARARARRRSRARPRR